MCFIADIYECGFYWGAQADYEAYRMLFNQKREAYMVRERMNTMILTYFDLSNIWNYRFLFRLPADDQVKLTKIVMQN